MHMIDEITNFLDQYVKWLKDNTTLRHVDDWVEITTPCLDRHNGYFRRRSDMSCYAISARKGWLVLLLLACVPPTCLTTARAAGLHLNRGGFSVDSSNAGAISTTGENLLRNGGLEREEANGRPSEWLPDSYVWFPTDQPAERASDSRANQTSNALGFGRR